MLILIEKNNNESYDEYDSWIDAIYDIPNETMESIKDRWLHEIHTEMNKFNIECNVHWPTHITLNSKNKSKRLHKKILKEFEINKWIQRTYKVKKIEFKTLKYIL
jgi:hypothetical protein